MTGAGGRAKGRVLGPARQQRDVLPLPVGVAARGDPAALVVRGDAVDYKRQRRGLPDHGVAGHVEHSEAILLPEEDERAGEGGEGVGALGVGHLGALAPAAGLRLHDVTGTEAKVGRVRACAARCQLRRGGASCGAERRAAGQRRHG